MTQNATETTDNINPEDLSKIVDELSSIRPGSNDPPSVNHGVVLLDSLMLYYYPHMAALMYYQCNMYLMTLDCWLDWS
jgi:hypothetical protein